MKKFFFIIWDDANFYNSLVFLSKYLSETNKIFIICKSPKKNHDFAGNLDFGRNFEFIYFFDNKIIPNKILYLLFLIKSLFLMKIKQPDYVIFFNSKSIFFIHLFKLLKKKFTKFIYHNFDYDIPIKYSNLISNFFHSLELSCARCADYLVFPSENRAKIFSTISNINFNKFYVMQNCFPKSFVYSKDKKDFQNILNKIVKDKKVICRMGSLGPYHYILETIEAIKFLDENYILILGGVNVNNYSKILKEKISNEKLEKKVFVFDNINNYQWFEILKKSHMGICFYEEISISNKNMAGTSTKFNNYIYSTLPILANDNTDFAEFKKKRDVLELVDPKNPSEIAKKINYILTNSARYIELKDNIYTAFNSELNFEYQLEQSYKKFL